MSIGKHVKEHAMLGVSGYGASTYTVGPGGSYSSVIPAVTAAAALDDITNATTFTMSMLESTTGGTLDKRILSVNGGTALTGFETGDLVGCKIDGSTSPILGIVYDQLNGIVLFKNPIVNDKTSVSVTIGYPNYKSIILQPGHVEDLAGTAIALPSFTTLKGLVRGTSRLSSALGTTVIAIDNTVNEIRVEDFQINLEDISGVRAISFTSSHYQSDVYLKGIDGVSAAQDYIFFADGLHGGLHMDDCNIFGGYDGLRLRQHREVNIRDCTLDAYSLLGSVMAQATAIALGTGSISTVPLEKYFFANNKLKSFGQSVVPGVLNHGSVRVIDVRNPMSSNAMLTIKGNDIYATGDSPSEVVGVKVAASSADTPTIVCDANTFDIRNNGTGAALTMDSDDADYVIQTAGNNIVLNGTLGSNTGAATVN